MMTEQYASVAIGTAAALIAALLVLLRAEFQNRRPFVALTRRWIAASTRTSGLVVGMLAVIAVSCFAMLPAEDELTSHSAFISAPEKVLHAHDTAPADDAVQALQAYAEGVPANPQPVTTTPPASKASALPDVETMISKLVTRLEEQPGDARGWKMLGWSYLNTDRPTEAAKAYEAAQKLEPNDAETMKGLEQAKSAQNASAKVQPTSQTASQPAAKSD